VLYDPVDGVGGDGIGQVGEEPYGGRELPQVEFQEIAVVDEESPAQYELELGILQQSLHQPQIYLYGMDGCTPLEELFGDHPLPRSHFHEGHEGSIFRKSGYDLFYIVWILQEHLTELDHGFKFYIRLR